MAEKKASVSRKLFISGAFVLTGVLVWLTVYIIRSPKLAETLIIMKDGQKVDSLDVNDIQIVPGNSSEYQVTLLTRLRDNYKLSFAVSGEKKSLADLITLNIIGDGDAITQNLGEALNSGYHEIGYKYIDDTEGYKVTVKYDFSSSITQDMIVPIDLKLNFTIGR